MAKKRGLPPADSVWQCPCGYTGKYLSVSAHRKGWQKRPACNGVMRPVDSSLLYDDVAEKEANQPDPLEPPTPEIVPPYYAATPEGETPFEGENLLTDDLTDPEVIARQLNQQFSTTDIATLARMSAPNGGGPPGTLPPGDWVAETGQGPVSVSEDRLTLTLPVMHLIMYNHAVGQGWHEGDGSLSAYVNSCLMSFYRHDLGIGLFIAPLEEVDNARAVDGRLALAGAGTDDKQER